MASKHRTNSLRHIERLFDHGVVAGCTDAELLERFAATRDAGRVAAIVTRHGPMVMAVCRSLLGCAGADADDAFQATFLVMMKRAGSFSVGHSLGGWLYQVARRVARQGRLADARRRRREVESGFRIEASDQDLHERSEIIRLIRQEVDRLPERYRSPIMLCDLQGFTREEAAGLLGWRPGTVGGRLARARRQLRDRLERRGLAPSVMLPILPRTAGMAGGWQQSLEEAIRTACSLVTGEPATPAALGLAARAGRSFVGLAVKLTMVATFAAVVTAGLVAARSARQPQTAPASAGAATSARKPTAVPDQNDPTTAGHFAGRVTGPEGQPVAGARLFIAPSNPLPTKPGPVRATTGADGRFEFDAPDMTYTGLDGLATRRQGLLLATAENFEPDWVLTWGQTGNSFRSHWDPVPSADFSLRLASDDVPIHGRLLDADGRPLAGARVRLAALQVPWKRDLDSHLKKFRMSKDQMSMFDYERSLYRPDILPGVASEVTTDTEGRFRFSGLGRDRLADLTVTAPSVVDTSLTVMTREGPDVIIVRDPDGYPARAILGAGFTLRMKPGRTVTGIVPRSRDSSADRRCVGGPQREQQADS